MPITIPKSERSKHTHPQIAHFIRRHGAQTGTGTGIGEKRARVRSLPVVGRGMRRRNERRGGSVVVIIVWWGRMGCDMRVGIYWGGQRGGIVVRLLRNGGYTWCMMLGTMGVWGGDCWVRGERVSEAV
jgi:hypothetical protein